MVKNKPQKKLTGSLTFIMGLTFLLYLVIIAKGGIDIGAYENNTRKSILYWSAYELKEVVSWLIIKLSFEISAVFGLGKPFLVLNVILMIIFGLFVSGLDFNKKILILAFIGPFGVMLAFNVLRQYIAVFFLMLSMLNLYHGKTHKSMVLAIFSCFSHSSIIPFVFLLYLTYFINNMFLCLLLFFVFFVFFVFINYFEVSLYSDGGITDGSNIRSWIKIVVNEAYLLFLFCLVKIRLNINKYQDKVSYECTKFVNVLFFVNLSILLLPLPVWAINRLIINIGIVFLIVIFYNSQYINKRMFVLLLFVFIFNIIATFAHPGAKEMLF